MNEGAKGRLKTVKRVPLSEIVFLALPKINKSCYNNYRLSSAQYVLTIYYLRYLYTCATLVMLNVQLYLKLFRQICSNTENKHNLYQTY